jgi:hypothetical protein
VAADDDEFAEKRDTGFGDAPVAGGDKNIAGEVEFAEESTGAGGLVAGDTNEVPGVFQRVQARTDIGVEIGAVEVFTETSIKTSLPLGIKAEAGTEVLKHLAVVFTAGDDRAEHRGESVPRNTEPIDPTAVFAGLVDEDLSDVEPDGADRRHGAAVLSCAASLENGRVDSMMDVRIRCWQPDEGNVPVGLSGCDAGEVFVEDAESSAVQRRCGGAEGVEAVGADRIGSVV